MEIRKVELDDVLEINNIRNYYINNTDYIFRREQRKYDEEAKFFKEVLEKDYPCLVYEEDNQILGFAYLSPFRVLDGYDRTMELSIFLKPNIQRNGIGSSILKEIENLSKDKYHCLVSVITRTNERSISFHKKNGFEIVGQMKEVGFINKKYIDIVIMQKNVYKGQ